MQWEKILLFNFFVPFVKTQCFAIIPWAFPLNTNHLKDYLVFLSKQTYKQNENTLFVNHHSTPLKVINQVDPPPPSPKPEAKLWTNTYCNLIQISTNPSSSIHNNQRALIPSSNTHGSALQSTTKSLIENGNSTPLIWEKFYVNCQLED